MQFLTVFHYPVYGGPQNQAARLNATLSSSGIHTTAVVPVEAQEAADRLSDSGVAVVPLPLHRWRATRDVRLQAETLGDHGLGRRGAACADPQGAMRTSCR